MIRSFSTTPLAVSLVFGLAGCDSGTITQSPDQGSEEVVVTPATNGDEGVGRAEQPVIGTLPKSLQYSIPALTGTSYSDLVPKSLELSDMARLSINGLTQPTDANDDFSLYFLTDWSQNPPVLRHEDGSDASQGKFLAPLLYNRIVSGSTQFFSPVAGVTDQYDILNRYLSQYHETSGLGGASSRAYEGFMLNYFRDGNPMWKTLILQAAQNIAENFVIAGTSNGEEYGYHPTDQDPKSFWAQDPWKDEVSLMAYRNLNYANGLGSVKKHIKYVKDISGIFGTDGSFKGQHDSGHPHFHIHGLYLQMFLQYYLLTGDSSVRDFVKKSYEWARGTAAGSVDLIGYFPEFVTVQQNAEGCSLSDMVNLALELSAVGVGDYWDDADRWTRNHFAEAQLTTAKGAKLDAYAAKLTPVMPVQSNESATNPTARSVGGFAGWPSVGNFRHASQRGIQQCCTGNGARSIYYAWDHIQTWNSSAKQLKVNLLLNRASAQADVYSYIPYSGRVDVKVKTAVSDLRVRIPNWVTKSAVVVKVGGTTINTVWDTATNQTQYVKVGSVSSGQTVGITFPISESTATQTIDGKSYTFIKRGNTIVNVTAAPAEPSISPLYDRAYMRTSTAPMVTVTRFVSSEQDLPTRKDVTWKLPVVNVTASNSSGGYTPDKMLDGDQDSASRWSSNGDGQYATFELDRLYDVKYVNAAFYLGDSRVQNFDILLSTDKSTWTSALSGATSNGISTSLQGFNVVDVTAKYVKLVGHKSSAGSYNDFTEFEIYGTVATAPVAFDMSKVTVSASGYDSSYQPSKTVDGSTADTSRWQKSGSMQWIKYDLGALKSVAQVQIAVYSGTTRAQKFDVEVSTNDENWVMVYTGRNDKTTKELQTYDFPNVRARYVRVVCRGTDGNTTNQLTEVRVFGF